MVTSIAGVTVFGNGENSQQIILEPAPTPLNQVFNLEGFGSGADEIARRNAMQMIRTEDLDKTLVQATGELTQQAINVSEQLSTDPTLTVTFPNYDARKSTPTGCQTDEISHATEYEPSDFFCPTRRI